MRILQINSGNIGSTGNIMLGVADQARKEGHICYTACPDGRSMRKRVLNDHFYIGTRFGRNLHLLLGKLTGLHGLFSVFDTWVFLSKVNKLNLDVIHLHNLHDCYINLPMLFRYIKKRNIRVVWTLHDCWAFTGQCPHFVMAKCNKWKTKCFSCPQYKNYPASYMDQSKSMWQRKKKWFTGVKDMTIVTPSHWLADLVKQSFLKEYPIKVINNGIDLSVFKPTKSDFREKYKISKEKQVLLGVTFGWGSRKGLDVFIELFERLDPQKYQIVLVGTDDSVDKILPSGIISVHRTQNQQELAQIYTEADLFVNPTREEVLGLVNIEANACGIPVLTFKTGGSPECIDSTSGAVVDCDDIDMMEKEIVRICNEKPYSSADCRARAMHFDKTERFKEYVQIYGSKE